MRTLSQLLPWPLHSPKTELTQESMMMNISLDFPQTKCHQTRDTNSCPSAAGQMCHVLKIYQECHPTRAMHKRGDTLVLKWSIWNQAAFQSSSVFGLDSAHVLRGWALRMLWACSPRAAGEHIQAPYKTLMMGCCRPPLSSPSTPEASGRAWMRVKWASPPEKVSPCWGNKSLSCSDTNVRKMHYPWI